MIFILPSSSIFYQVLCIYSLLFFWLQKGGLLIPAKTLFAAVLLFPTLLFLQSLYQSIREILSESTSSDNELLKSKVLVSRRLWRDECSCFGANNFHFKGFLLILFICFRLPGKIALNWVLDFNHSCLAVPERLMQTFSTWISTRLSLQPFMKANHRERLVLFNYFTAFFCFIHNAEFSDWLIRGSWVKGSRYDQLLDFYGCLEKF